MTELIKQKKQVPQRLYSNKKLAALLIPLALDQLLNSFMGTIDTLVVSNLGSAAISAVSLVDSINILIVQAFFALASGGTVVCSHYLGCKSKDHAKEAARQLVFVTLMLSLIIGAICLVFNQQILNLIFGKVEKDVMAGAKQYFFYSVLSYPFIALYNDGACILRAQNNSKFPMQISIVSNFLNAFLDVIFVWVFHWGVAGSAIATAGSRFFSMSIVLWKLRNPSLEIPFRNYFSIRPNWREIKKILNIGIPSGIENSMFQFGKLAIQSTVSLMGTAAIAAQGMTNVIENLNGILAIGIGIGLMTVVGETLGAGRKEEAVYYIKKLCIIAEITLAVSCLIFYLLVRPITYFGGMEPESGHDSGRHGAGECEDVSLHGRMDHGGKADRLDARIYSGIWITCGRGCKVFYDSFCAMYVVLQSKPCYFPCKSLSYGSDGGMDWYVCGLGCSKYNLYDSL